MATKNPAVWFNGLPRLVQIILLLIPGVNQVVEIVIRWSAFIHTKSILTLVVAIIVTFFGFVFGWVDVIWCLLFKHLIFANA